MTSHTCISGESQRTITLPAAVQIMIMVQHPQRIQSRHFGNSSLLPVKPPEIHAFFFQRMMQFFQIHFHEMWICRIKLYRDLTFRIDSHLFSHTRIQLLVCTDSIGRMHIQCNLHIVLMQPGHKSFWIREEVFVPGISCPAASVFRIYIVNNMPVHINNSYRERQFFVFKTFYQFFIFILCVTMITAPPVTKCISWQQRLFSTQIIEIFQTFQITMSISEEIQILAISLSRTYPSVFCQCHRMTVIHNSKSFS